MRYILHLIRSPRLVLQLLLMLMLASLIGGTGLVGLRRARGAVTDISTVQMPALVHLLNAEREIAQTNYYGLSGFIDPDPRHRARVELPEIHSLSTAAWQNFQQFQSASPDAGRQAALRARVSQLLQRWLALSVLAQALATTASPDSIGGTAQTVGVADTTVVQPLMQALTQLVQLNEENVTDAGDATASSTQTATVLLLGVIVLAVFVTGAFQVAIVVREHRRRTLAQQSADLVMLLEAQGAIRYASPSCERLLGYRPSAVQGRPILDLIHPSDQSAVTLALARYIQDNDCPQEEFRFQHATGSYRWMAVTAVNQLHDSLIGGIVLTSRDVTARKQTEAALAFQASHDPLTCLPNRLMLRERLDQALVAAANTGNHVGLLLLDLDRFKEVNDTLGHHTGDLLLQQVGQRLSAALRIDDMVARLGGDEYAVLLPATNEATALYLADRLSRMLEEPFSIAEQALEIGASIGIALYPAHGEDPHLLLQHADVAMYQAKRNHQRAMVYNAEHDQYSLRRLALIRDLRPAIQDHKLILYYQPKLDLATYQLRGVEALLRWPHPAHGFIPPDQFIPLAEQTGLIGPLTDWVLETTLRQCKAWQDAGRRIPVAVNLSARVLQDQQLPDRIARLLMRHALLPGNLTLEITESSLMTDPIRAKDVLTSLHALGVQLSIDDFGTGYSSLGYLKELPVQELKIDKSFVLGMGAVADTKDAAIVRSVIAMAHALELTVVAEGVEDTHMQAVLADLACDTIQGYHICRPLPADDLEHWLRSIDSLPDLLPDTPSLHAGSCSA